ncbi:acetyl-CoA hydrolase/transferase C-terminal domain-containing protein, partial [Acetobacter lovaniensis]|uniref:acetyl-CoA hydrolase/transferase C-terminal domain-containing protein n=1 Tax=Acetobacter lovaniensis TaxID=104100 RepID=UPI00376FD7AD
ITGSRKEINRGKIVSAFVMGTSRLYRFIDDNPMVELRPVDHTNDTSVIRRLSRMTAINSAIEVDLTGQVVADSIGWKLYSGVGGQMDFMRGAA